MPAHPNVFIGLPSADLFSFSSLQDTPLPTISALAKSSFWRPFNIPQGLFFFSLDFRWPATLCLAYVFAAITCNRSNKARGYRPWPMTSHRLFSILVITHNILLAIYSAWASYTVFKFALRTIVSPFGPAGFAATVDSLCRIHAGPGAGMIDRGQQHHSPSRRFGKDSLNYYYWMYYASKFWEFADTFILLAKGKRASFLQVFHHTGAAFAAFLGLRYSSSSPWLPLLLNTVIHTMMYSYYTLTAFHVRISVKIKRLLTSLQILQFFAVIIFLTLQLSIYYILEPPGSNKATFLALQPCLPNLAEASFAFFVFFYMIALTYLFTSFFIASYLKPKRVKTTKSAATK